MPRTKESCLTKETTNRHTDNSTMSSTMSGRRPAKSKASLTTKASSARRGINTIPSAATPREINPENNKQRTNTTVHPAPHAKHQCIHKQPNDSSSSSGEDANILFNKIPLMRTDIPKIVEAILLLPSFPSSCTWGLSVCHYMLALHFIIKITCCV